MSTFKEIKCVICQSKEAIPAEYLPNKFNDKLFEYYKCTSCLTIFIDPMPNEEDLTLMYSGTNDHTYLDDVERYEHHNKFDKYHYRWHQLRNFNRNKSLLQGKKILDIGCGNGFYLKNAIRQGFEGIGIEFDKKFTEVLSQKTDLQVFTIDEVEATGEKFDIIHIGHMLEHLTDPGSYMKRIFDLGHKKTYFIIDGPVENNDCLSRNFVDYFAKRNYRNKTKKYNEYDPQHLTFTTFESQLLFFEKLGLKTVKYEVHEQPWPLSNKFSSLSPKAVLTAIISKISIAISNMNVKQGNVFHYIGQPKD